MSAAPPDDFLNRRLFAGAALANLEGFATAPVGRYLAAGGETVAAVARLYYGQDRADLAVLIAGANGVQPGVVLAAGATLVIPPATGRNRAP